MLYYWYIINKYMVARITRMLQILSCFRTCAFIGRIESRSIAAFAQKIEISELKVLISHKIKQLSTKNYVLQFLPSFV